MIEPPLAYILAVIGIRSHLGPWIRNPDPEVKNEGLFSTETAENRPEEQTEGGHHRRHSPDEASAQRVRFKLENHKKKNS